MSEAQKLQLRVKYKDGVEPMVRANDGEWFDLRAAREYVLFKGDIIKIDLGIAMELPAGYEAMIRPRSSTAEEYGIMLADSGVIDNRYNGDNDWWNFEAYVIRPGVIHKNDRICQFRILPEQPKNYMLDIQTVDFLGNEDRGGFGSTGRR